MLITWYDLIIKSLPAYYFSFPLLVRTFCLQEALYISFFQHLCLIFSFFLYILQKVIAIVTDQNQLPVNSSGGPMMVAMAAGDAGIAGKVKVMSKAGEELVFMSFQD